MKTAIVRTVALILLSCIVWAADQDPEGPPTQQALFLQFPEDADNAIASGPAGVDLGSLRKLVTDVSGETPRDYMTYDFGRARDTNAMSVVVPEDRLFEVVTRLRNRLPEGYVVFAGTNHWLGDEVHIDHAEVVVAKGKGNYDILRLARSDAVNYGMLTEDLIEWFKAREDVIKIAVVQATTDMIFAEVVIGPKDIDSFIEELYLFCPDIVDQGSGNIDDLRVMIEQQRMLFLWWD